MPTAEARHLPDAAGSGSHGQLPARARPEPDLLVDLRQAGWPIQEIAKRLGLSRATTYRWLVRYGIPRRPIAVHRGAAPRHDDHDRWIPTADLLALWADYKPDIDRLAQRTGIRPAAVRERLITAGGLPEHRPT